MNSSIELFLKELPLDDLRIDFKRHKQLTDIGSSEKYLYYILSGAVIAYIAPQEDEQVIRLGYKENIINALPSFLSGAPSDIGIRAIRAGSAYRIPKPLFRAAIDSSSEHLKQYTQMLEQLFIQQTERELDLLTSAPAVRLARVLKRSPQLFQEVPAKYIASYLRMSPETLSRMM